MSKLIMPLLAMTSQIIAPAPNTNSFVPDATHEYKFKKLIQDIESGFDGKKIAPFQQLFLLYIKDTAKFNERSQIAKDILGEFNTLFNHDQSLNISESIKTFINHHPFTKVSNDDHKNKIIFDKYLVTIKDKIISLKTGHSLKEKLLKNAKTTITNKASEYNLDLSKGESKVLKSLLNDLDSLYYSSLENANYINNTRPFKDSSHIGDLFNKKLNEKINTEEMKNSLKQEMWTKFAGEVQKLPINNFDTKQLKILIANKNADKYNQVFPGLTKLVSGYKAKQSTFNAFVKIEKPNNVASNMKTKFIFNSNNSNNISQFIIEVDTPVHHNLATKVKSAIKSKVQNNNISIQENIAESLLTDKDFVKFRNSVAAIKNAISLVTNHEKVKIESKISFDNNLPENLLKSKMNVHLILTDTNEANKVGASDIDKEFAKTSYDFSIIVLRTIDNDFVDIKEAIKAKNPPTVFKAEAASKNFEAGKIWKQSEVEEFLKNVSSGDNVGKVLEKYNGKDYSLTASIKSNNYKQSDPDKRIVIEYIFKELSGKKYEKKLQIGYKITETPMQRVIYQLNELKLTDNNPINPGNINTYVDRSNLAGLIVGYNKLVTDASNLPENIIITNSKFYQQNGNLMTTFSVQEGNKQSVTMTTTKQISFKFLSQTEIDNIKKENHITKNHITIGESLKVLEFAKDKTSIAGLKQKLIGIKKEAAKKLDNLNFTKQKDVEKIVKDMKIKINKTLIDSLQSDHDKLTEEVMEKYGGSIPKKISEKLKELQKVIEGIDPKKTDINEIKKLSQKLNLSNLLKKTKILSNISKYALLGVGGLLGLGGLVSLLNAFKIWTTNKKMKEIPGNKIKLKSAKKMGLLSMLIGLISVGGSIALMLFIFILKGGF